MNKIQGVRLSIRTKLFLLILIAFTALILVTLWQVGEQARRASSTSIERSLGQAEVVLATKIESRFNTITEVATSIARDGRILPLVFDAQSSTLQDQSLEFQRVLEFDVLFFTDARGTILARSDRPAAIGQNLAGKSSLLDTALSGKVARGYFQSQGMLMQIVVVPIFDNIVPDVVRGSIALAYELNEQLADEINALTASTIGFFIFSRDQSREVTGSVSTHSTDPALAEKLNHYFSAGSTLWQSIYRADGNIPSTEVQLDDEAYYALAHGLRNGAEAPLGFVVALHSSRELLRPFTEIQRNVILTGIVCLVFASVFALVFSLRISRPIIRLVAVAREIQEDTFKRQPLPPATGDEVGLLYQAVVQMGNTLKEKAELESYLAQIANELNQDQLQTLPLEHKSISPDLQAVAERPGLPAERTLEFPKPAADTTEHSDILPPHYSEDGPNFLAGTKVAERYELIRAIGRGAIGFVFLARDLDLDEQVAIKLMPQELFSRHQSINFKEEIRLARKITHRNILRTFDFGSWENYYFITMEYVLGFGLDEMLKRTGAMDLQICILIARQICSAIDAAHAQGIIHLDLKPANMIINRQGILKIMDFGLAKRLATHDAGLQTNGHTELTPPEVMMGTPKYMAPEQFLGAALDERTDIYSIGIILFTLLAGHAPFEASNLLKLAELHLHGELPKLPRDDADISNNLLVIIQRAVEKQPEHRYSNIREMLMDLTKLTSYN